MMNMDLLLIGVIGGILFAVGIIWLIMKGIKE